MDTYTQPVPPKRRYLELEQKRRIVEETLGRGSVGRTDCAIARSKRCIERGNWYGLRTRPIAAANHPQQHLRKFQGELQADAYAGFNQLYKDDRIQEVACWAHYPESGIIQSEL